MTVTDEEFLVWEEVELESPCDFGTMGWYSHGHAEWIAHFKCQKCPHAGQRLICTSCVNAISHTEDFSFECGSCGELHAPARRFFTRLEPL